MSDIATISRVLSDIARQYPPELVDAQLRDVPRIAFNISLVTAEHGTRCRVADLGGGIGMFSVGCAALGMDAVLVDDFEDAVNLQHGGGPLALHAKYGVTVVKRNVVQDSLDFAPASFDTITTFDSMEHWHNSPKRLFHDVAGALRPGGLFVLGVPNCVNLRKRISVPLGIGSWSLMQDWYEEKTFRGHVREPDVTDLRYIARDMALEGVRIVGRNWLGYISRFPLVRLLTPAIDRPLQLFPSLCADLYLLGRKPAQS